MYKCTNGCMYYRIIRKDGKFKGFCDFTGMFFEELKKDAIIERMENCTDYRNLVNGTTEK